MPTIKGGGEMGEEWETVVWTAVPFPHMDLVAISKRDTWADPSNRRTAFLAYSTSSLGQSSSSAPMAQSRSFNSAQAFSTAFPVT